jgi:cytosine/adenosine deaminase-related metal-dependent hydrolase
MKAITNVQIYDFHSLLPQAFVVFDKDIQAVGTMDQWEKVQGQFHLTEAEVLDGQGKLLIPNLVIGHTHIYSTFARGLSLPYSPKSFQDVLDQLWWKLDAKLTKAMCASSAEIAALGYIQNGVGSVIDHHASGTDILGTLGAIKKAVVEDAGLRGMFCFETSDRFDLDLCIKENLDFMDSAKPGHWSGHFGMHASMSLSDESLKQIKAAIGDRPIHIHVAESQEDVQDARTKYGKTIIQRLDDHGLVNKNSLIVHGIYLEDAEMETIARRGAWAAVNPSSNMNNGVGLPDIKKMQFHGLKVLLGNDGMSPAIVNEWQDLLLGMHHRYADPVAFGLGDLSAIIQNGYEYFNNVLGSKIGKIKQGYEADFFLLDYQAPTPLTLDNALGHLFFGQGHAFRPIHLWSRGVLKLKDYQHSQDTSEIYERARRLSAQLWESLQ